MFSYSPGRKALRFGPHKNSMVEAVILVTVALPFIKICNSVKKENIKTAPFMWS